MKQLFAILTLFALVGVVSCGGDNQPPAEQKKDAGAATAPQAPASQNQKTVIVIAKSYQNQFYQAAFKGAEKAAADLGVRLTTNGPDAESNVSQQVDQVAAAINQKPDALVLAASDPKSLEEALGKAKAAGIPVIGFDSGVPGDPTGAVLATATTDNEIAGGNVAKNLAAAPSFQEKVAQASEQNPVVIGALAQDATSGSISLRITGFVNALKEEVERLDGLKGAVSISGQQKWNVPATAPVKVKIVVTVPPTTSQSDIQSAAKSILMTNNLIALFAANQDAVNGVISATNDATDLDRTQGKYKDVLVVGFDAGKSQKDAIKNGQFFGSVTQDPYQMGYQAVKLAVDAINKQPVADVDTGSRWYNKDNIEAEDIAILLYD